MTGRESETRCAHHNWDRVYFCRNLRRRLIVSGDQARICGAPLETIFLPNHPYRHAGFSTRTRAGEMTQRPPGNNGAHACLVSRLQQLARSRQGIAWGGRLACDGAGLCAAVTVARLAIAPSKTRSKAALVADFLAATTLPRRRV